MPTTTNRSKQAQSIWFDSSKVEGVSADWFSPEYWHQKGLITGQATGRGTTVFFKYAGNEMVLRHYRRGGLIGKLLTDQYCFTGLENTRAWRELKLLLKMQEYGLPSPVPIAAMVEKKSFYYCADIITARIPHAEDLHHILLNQELDEATWSRIGATIRLFHQLQIYHHDLNIHNIMMDKDQNIWLIDFDKCEERAGEKWKKQNMDRLNRSLLKEQGKNPDYHYQDKQWNALLAGYHKRPD